MFLYTNSILYSSLNLSAPPGFPFSLLRRLRQGLGQEAGPGQRSSLAVCSFFVLFLVLFVLVVLLSLHFWSRRFVLWLAVCGWFVWFTLVLLFCGCA